MGQISHQVVWRDGSCGLRLKATLSTQAKERERVELDRKANKDRHALLELAKRGDHKSTAHIKLPKITIERRTTSVEYLFGSNTVDVVPFSTTPKQETNVDQKPRAIFGIDKTNVDTATPTLRKKNASYMPK